MRIEELKEEVIQIRRHLHGIPELAFNELETSRFIKEKLLELGFRVESVAKTGVLAFKKGESNKRPICFRADIDALPINENTGLEFSSKNEKMHGCGHDAHMAILLGFAIYLSKLENIKRDVLLLFQPGEENAGGAEVVLNDKIFKNYNVENIFGLHVQPEIYEGKIGLRSGPFMAQTIEFNITVKGKSSHGAQPHNGVDSLYAASQLLISYQSIISRNIDPLQPAVLTIGKFNGGAARNLIAEEVILEGTLRTFDMNTYKLIKGKMMQINEGIEKTYNVEIETEFIDFCPPVVNDNKLFKEFVEILDKEEFIEMDPMTISEDFGFYQTELPGLFFMLGSKNEELGYVYPLHNPKFDFNEDILLKGLDMYIRIGRKFAIL